MTTMTKEQATDYLNKMTEEGNVVFLNNDNQVLTISDEIDELNGDYVPPVVCDYNEFEFFSVAEIIAEGFKAISIYEASNAEENYIITLCKYEDPYEPAIDGIDPDKARAVCEEDPGLIYVVVQN